MADYGFRSVMEQKSNEALLAIVTMKRKDYQSNAILDAEEILRERGCEVPVAEQEEEEAIEESSVKEAALPAKQEGTEQPGSPTGTDTPGKKALDPLPVVFWIVSIGVLLRSEER